MRPIPPTGWPPDGDPLATAVGCRNAALPALTAWAAIAGAVWWWLNR